MRLHLIPRISLTAAAVLLGWAALTFQASAADEPAAADSASVDTSAAEFPAGDAKKGKKIFTAKGCVACHKADGSGGIKLGGNPTPDWRDPERMNDPKYDDAYMRDCITNGKPKSGMVPWKSIIKPEQIEDLIAYIHTFEKKQKKK